MNPVSLRTLLLVGMALSCGVVILLWLGADWRRARREKAARSRLRQCRLCFHCFEDASESPIIPCPRCNAPTLKTRLPSV